MALTLVTAPPGSGKTLWMVWRILQLVNEGRLIYTNIDGLNVDGVLPIPDWTDDWRDLPNDSVVVYDEAQEHPAFDKYATITDKTKKAYYHDIAHSLAIHRHFGFDIFLLTQSPNLIAGHVLGFVNKHIHLRRNFGFERATVYHFIEAQTNTRNPRKNGQLENTTTFSYPKSLYNVYKSATTHTHKAYFPLKYVFIILFPIAALLFTILKGTDVFQNNEMAKGAAQAAGVEVSSSAPTATKPATTSTDPAPTGDNPTASTTDQPTKTDTQAANLAHELQRVAHVIEFGSECYAKNSYGELLDIPPDQCRLYSSRPSLLSGSRIQQVDAQVGRSDSVRSPDAQFTVNQL